MENDQNKTPTPSGLPDENAPPVDLMSDSPVEEPKDKEPTLAPSRAPSDRKVIDPLTPGLTLPDKQPLSDLSTGNAVTPDIGGGSVISGSGVAGATPGIVVGVPASPNPVQNVVGSQIAPQKPKRLIGVYLIGVFSLLGFVASFFDTAQGSLIYTIVMLLDLLLAIGLLAKIEGARKIIVGLMTVSVVFYVVAIFMLIALQDKISNLEVRYDEAIAKVDTSKFTDQQNETFKKLKDDIANKQKQLGETITFSYIKLGVSTVGSSAVIIYLTRPKIKEQFHSSD